MCGLDILRGLQMKTQLDNHTGSWWQIIDRYCCFADITVTASCLYCHFLLVQLLLSFTLQLPVCCCQGILDLMWTPLLSELILDTTHQAINQQAKRAKIQIKLYIADHLLDNLPSAKLWTNWTSLVEWFTVHLRTCIILFSKNHIKMCYCHSCWCL